MSEKRVNQTVEPPSSVVIATSDGDNESTKQSSPTQREHWSSRFAFYFATAGAAIGFGNVWRFPGLSVQYGGGAFFIPYLMALFFVGIPLAILEIGFGQYFQTGDIGVFGGFHPRLRGVGVCSLVCGFIVSSYYIVLIGWVVNAFFSTFDEDAPWGNPELSGEEAVDYFYNNIIGMNTVVSPDLKPTRIVLKNVAYTALVWLVVFCVTAFGLQTTGRFTYVTMGLPVVLLFVFLVRAATLPGAGDGVHAYIGEWDLSVLQTNGEVWSVACSQVFFSISLTFGILTSYGSHCKRDEPAVLNSCVIVAANSMFSVLTGFAVFCALGHLAYKAGVSVTDIPYGGFSLVFGTWPVVLGTLPGGIHWVRLLFFDLFLLGIDSAFAFVECKCWSC
jgi:solute carrier family 6 GABA transporter-like protein 1